MKFKNKKEANANVKNLIPITKIKDGYLELNGGRRITILKVEPTNFKLKTQLEQKAILEGYKLFLKSCKFDIQILVQTQKRDLEEYIKNMKAISYKNSELKEMLDDYIQFLKKISSNKEIVCRSFYIVVETTSENEEEIILKITESLKSCDNEVKRCDSFEVMKVVRNYLNRKII